MIKILQQFRKVFLVISMLIIPCLSYSQVLLEADGNDHVYEFVRSVGLKLELPDCIHPVKHVMENFDHELNKYVFVFETHLDVDNDRCKNLDRQRIELTVCDSLPPDYLGARDDDTFTYSWKFKLDGGFQPSNNFSDLHQIKAVGGTDDGSPLITLNAVAGNPEKLHLDYAPPKGGSGGETLKEINLSAVKDQWIEVTETVKFNDHGKFSILLKNVSDGSVLLSYNNNDINLKRAYANFYRPKIGLYRSLKSKSLLRDEDIKIADFCISKGSVSCIAEKHKIAPATPSKLVAKVLSDTQINLTWRDNAFNENLFRLEHSVDNGKTWTTTATITPAWERKLEEETYTSAGLTPGKSYSYRVSAENLFGKSDYSEIVKATTLKSVGNN